jgi:nitrogen PTS system EIIA component
MVEISKYLDEHLIVFLDAHTRDEALHALIDCLDSKSKLKDKEAFYQAVLAREKIVSTGIGMGVAIPHAKLPLYDEFFIIIGIQKQGIEWKALDGAPVRLIFLIGGPDDKQTEYLQLLSRLTLAIKDAERRKNMLLATSPREILDLFSAERPTQGP